MHLQWLSAGADDQPRFGRPFARSISRRNARPAARCRAGGRASAAWQVDDIEAEIQILAELCPSSLRLRDRGWWWRSGGFDLDRRGAADAVDLALLNARSSLACRRVIHLADFVEQQRAAIGLLELADAAGDGAGEGALFMAEQLAFQQIFRNGGAIDGDEIACRARLLRWMKRAITSLPVPLSPVMRMVASLCATCSASRTTWPIDRSRDEGGVFFGNRLQTAAISSASGGSGIYSLAPARMARTAAPASVPMPQATTGTFMLSDFRLSISSADIELDIAHHEIGALSAAQAFSAPSMLSIWETLAPRGRDRPAAPIWPSSGPTMSSLISLSSAVKPI